MSSTLNQITALMDNAAALLSLLYETKFEFEPSRRDRVTSVIDKYAPRLRKSKPTVAALVVFAILKNEPLVPTYANFNGHLAYVLAVTIAGDDNLKYLVAIPREGSILLLDKLATLAADCCVDLTAAMSLTRRWREPLSFFS